MAVTTTDSFLQRLAKSHLLDPEQLAQVQVAARQTDDVKKLARSLVRQEMLTRWQAIQLLAGRSAFFLGKYKLIDLLGSGGMGRVFLAEHTTMGRPVALKIIAKHLAQDPVSLKQFLTEARAIAALDHPNIVHPYSVDSEGDRYYMVMEYVKGRDLQRTVEADGPLEFDRAADYVRQAADGLAHAHSREMIHCDVKPANLLVNRQDVVKILDMGMARLTGRGKGRATEKDDRLLGTVDYLAPEQALDSPDLDHRVDIYSLGCTFYFLLTGRPPFPEGTLHERILKHQTESPRPIRELRPDAPEDLVEICERMMAKAPDDRYATADDLSRVLAERQPVLEMAEPAEPAEAIVEPESPGMAAGIRAETPTTSSARRKAGGAPRALARMRGSFTEHPRMWLFAGLGGVAALGLVVAFILLLAGPGEGPDDQSVAQTVSAGNQASSEKSAQDEPTEPEEPEADDEWPDFPDLGNLRDFDPEAISKADPGAPGKSGQAALPEKPKEENPGAEKQGPEKPASEGLKMGTPANPPQAKPAPAEAKPPEKPEPPKPAPQPNEPAKTAPAKTEPEEPKPEKKAPEKPKPQDPLRELAEAIDIPELSNRSGAPKPEPFTIGKIQTEADVPWQLYLLGGGTVLRRNRAFVLQQVERDAAKASWRIQLETAATSGDSTREDVARIYREGSLLQFHWAEDAPSSSANYLRNCILQVRVEGKSKYLALTTPRPVEPIPIDLERGLVNASAAVKWLPEGGDVRVEITKVEGREGHVVEPPEPAELKKPLQIGFPRKDRNGNTPDGVVFRLTLNPRPAAMSVKLQLLEPPPTSFRALKGQAEIRRNQLEIVRDELNKKLKPANRDQAPKGEEKSRLLRDLDGIEMNMWYIDFYNEVQGKATIHYRVFTKIDGREVVLASTEGGPSPEGPPPADSPK